MKIVNNTDVAYTSVVFSLLFDRGLPLQNNDLSHFWFTPRLSSLATTWNWLTTLRGYCSSSSLFWPSFNKVHSLFMIFRDARGRVEDLNYYYGLSTKSKQRAICLLKFIFFGGWKSDTDLKNVRSHYWKITIKVPYYKHSSLSLLWDNFSDFQTPWMCWVKSVFSHVVFSADYSQLK